MKKEVSQARGSLLGQMLAQKNTAWACDLKQTAGEKFVFSHQSRDTLGGLSTQEITYRINNVLRTKIDEEKLQNK